jgi:hypothetical protein
LPLLVLTLTTVKAAWLTELLAVLAEERVVDLDYVGLESGSRGQVRRRGSWGGKEDVEEGAELTGSGGAEGRCQR